MTRSLRLLAGTLVLALPLAAAAGCGAEKKKTVKQEFAAAQSYLGDSKAASFTLRFDDAQGNFAKVINKDGRPRRPRSSRRCSRAASPTSPTRPATRR